MFNPLCLLLIFTLCCQYVSSRHLAKKQPFYPQYSDFSYTYSGPSFQLPLHQTYHSPLYSPPGTYFDQRQGVLRPFPGGGVPVLVDYHKRCSNKYVGLKAHPDQQQYYYVCKPDCVIFGKCQNLQIFNATSGQCVQHPPPEYIPTCTREGRFPLFSDCHLYYKCEEDLQPKIYACPTSMIFSPASKSCINGNKCTHTQISPHGSYIPEYCANKFPPCFENGVFRSPSDCSLYYKCDLKNNGVYLQTRSRCPQGEFYDLQKHKCLPAKEVPCDCIQVAELVYPKSNAVAYQPAVYPSQYQLESLEEIQYPVEEGETKEERNDNCYSKENKYERKSEEDVNEKVITTLAPSGLEKTANNDLVEENENDIEAAVLSDYINIEDEDDKTQSIEDDKLTQHFLTTTSNSVETTNAEESVTQTDSAEQVITVSQDNENITTSDQSKDETKGTTANVTEKKVEVAKTTTTTQASREITIESDSLIEESEKTLTEVPVDSTENEIKITNSQENETTIARNSLTGSVQLECENSAESFENKIESLSSTVTAAPCIEPDHGNRPRLEIIVERPIDVHFSICPATCVKNHTHNYSRTGRRAVLLKWFANKSKQTLGFETANVEKTDDV